MGKLVAAGMISMVVVVAAFLLIHTPAADRGQSLVPSISAPVDGASVEGPVKVHIQYPDAGLAGHIHLLVDVDPPKPGDYVPMDQRHLHLMNFEKETVIELPPGPHRLQLLLGTPDHRVPNPPVLSKPVNFTVDERVEGFSSRRFDVCAVALQFARQWRTQ